MKHSNTDAIYAEYPFLEKLFPRKRVRTARVTRFDDNFPTKTAYVCDGLFSYCKKMYFLDKNGNIVTRVGGWRCLLLYGTRFERVDQALNRIGYEKASRVHFAVFYPNEYYGPRARAEQDKHSSLILFKLPPGFTNAAKWYDDIVERDREALQDA